MYHVDGIVGGLTITCVNDNNDGVEWVLCDDTVSCGGVKKEGQNQDMNTFFNLKNSHSS